MENVVIGIDIGGTNSVFAIVNQEGEILKKGHISTKDYPVFEKYAQALYNSVMAEFNSHALNLKGIGIGAPNGNYYNGTIEFAPNLDWEGVVNLSESFEALFNVPVFVTNDANAAALGEMMFGGARDMKEFMVITLGTGLGSGIVVNGNLVYGHDGFAGELGHVIVKADGRYCGCGRRGCLETYSSVTGLKKNVLALLHDHDYESPLKDLKYDDLSGKVIEEYALQGDEVAQQAFEMAGEYLGKALANAVAVTSPEAIFIFGGLAQAGELIFKPVKYHMEKNLLNIYKNKVKILPSLLPGADAAILGAAALAWKELK